MLLKILQICMLFAHQQQMSLLDVNREFHSARQMLLDCQNQH